jgi:hypothetical protein
MLKEAYFFVTINQLFDHYQYLSKFLFQLTLT